MMPGSDSEHSGFGSDLALPSTRTREFQTQLLRFFSKSDNKSNHHHLGALAAPGLPVARRRRQVRGCRPASAYAVKGAAAGL